MLIWLDCSLFALRDHFLRSTEGSHGTHNRLAHSRMGELHFSDNQWVLYLLVASKPAYKRPHFTPHNNTAVMTPLTKDTVKHALDGLLWRDCDHRASWVGGCTSNSFPRDPRRDLHLAMTCNATPWRARFAVGSATNRVLPRWTLPRNASNRGDPCASDAA